jgi:hypothetical protein
MRAASITGALRAQSRRLPDRAHLGNPNRQALRKAPQDDARLDTPLTQGGFSEIGKGSLSNRKINGAKKQKLIVP